MNKSYQLGSKFVVTDKQLFASALIYTIVLVMLIIVKPVLAVIFGFFPFLLLLFLHGPTAIAVLIISTFTFHTLDVGVTFLPADIVAIIVLGAYALNLMLKGSNKSHNPLLLIYIIYLIVMLISLSLEWFTPDSLRNYSRQLLLFGTFLAVVHFGRYINPKHIFIIFVIAAIANSLISLGQFTVAGGAIRAWGLAGRGFGDHAMLGFIISSIMYLFSKNLTERVLWGTGALIMVGGLAVIQTRASIITAIGASLALIIIITWFMKGKTRGRVKGNILLSICLLAAIIPIILLTTPLFEGISHRFSRVGLEPSGTILLRYSLWKAALGAFLDNPIFGIGAGNFRSIHLWNPEVRFDPIFFMVKGLGTHSVIMTALVENGLVGLCVLILMFYRSVKIAFKNFKLSISSDTNPAALILLIITIAIMGSSFYAGSWFWGNNSYHMAVFWGLMVSSYTAKINN